MVRLESIAPASSARSRASSKFVNGLSKDPVLSEFDLLSKNKRGSLATTSGSRARRTLTDLERRVEKEEKGRGRTKGALLGRGTQTVETVLAARQTLESRAVGPKRASECATLVRTEEVEFEIALLSNDQRGWSFLYTNSRRKTASADRCGRRAWTF